MTARTPQRQRLIQLLGPVITAQGYDLEDLSVSAAGRRSVVRVIVDGDHGIDLDAVADVSRAVSDVLDGEDAAEVLPGAFVLEVSSPGVDRPLTEVRHWRRAIGRLVDTITTDGQPVSGRISSVTGDSVTLDVAGTAVSYPVAALGPGRLQVEFTRPGAAADDLDDESDDAFDDEFDDDTDDSDEQADGPVQHDHTDEEA